MNKKSGAAEFLSKFVAYCCILAGVSPASTMFDTPLTMVLNLCGIACAVGSVWWLLRLRQRFG